MVRAGAHPKLLQSQMGHASIRITLDLYGHLYPDVGADTARAPSS
jgi:integrase